MGPGRRGLTAVVLQRDFNNELRARFSARPELAAYSILLHRSCQIALHGAAYVPQPLLREREREPFVLDPLVRPRRAGHEVDRHARPHHPVLARAEVGRVRDDLRRVHGREGRRHRPAAELLRERRAVLGRHVQHEVGEEEAGERGDRGAEGVDIGLQARARVVKRLSQRESCLE
jgi:hypothetical protein